MSERIVGLSAETKDFSAEGEAEGAQLVARFRGTADLRAQAPLAPLLVALHDEALRRAADEVLVDFHDLEFMNSSCFKSFVSWIERVQGLPRPYRIVFRGNPQLEWQRRSLQALRGYAADVVSVEDTV